MKWPRWLILLCVVAAVLVGAVSVARRKAAFVIGECVTVGRLPRIRPDYADVVIPPNIAPLNFLVQEPGSHYRVRMSSARGKPIDIPSLSPVVVIPPGPWRDLLAANRGEELRWDVWVQKPEGRWHRFDTITNTIAPDDIDGYLVYRLMRPLYNLYRDVGVYQRNLANYDESVVLHGKSFSEGCVNCHSFWQHRTQRMTLGVRSPDYGNVALIVQDGEVTKVDAMFGQTSWHPSGRLVAYSVYKVRQFFHSGGAEVRDVLDLDSDLLYYEVGSETVKTAPGIAHPDKLETYPSWSADGRYLYFASAPILWEDRNTVPPERYAEVRYDLMRIPYDLATDTWGEPETVLSSDATGLSIVQPRASPDGRFLLFCMCEYSCFPLFKASGDVYLMELETGEYRRLECNSDRSESWPSWSSNSRWIVFTSKRRDGIFVRPYMSYLDETGKVHKAVLLPQKDPLFYDSFLKGYTLPELITEPVQVSARGLAKAVRSPDKLTVELPPTSMTPKGQEVPPWRSSTSENEWNNLTGGAGAPDRDTDE